MDRYYIGIDPSFTCTGIALIIPAKGQLLKITTEFKSPAEISTIRRIVAIRNYAQVFLAQTIKDYAPHLDGLGNCGGAFIEGPSLNSPGRNDDKGQLRGALSLWLHDEHIEPIPIPPKTLKKFGACHGSANKEDMVNWAQMHGWEIEKTQHDMADAAHLADMAYTLINHRIMPLRKKQLEALNSIGELK